MESPPKKPLVVANWKMNGSTQSNSEWAARFTALSHVSVVDVVVCPPYPYLAQMEALLRDTDIMLGAQNLNENHNGAVTGEVSADMLSDCGCRYIIVGHSERRNFFVEDNEMIGMKMRRVMDCGMVPILCVGETYAQREAGRTKGVIQRQLRLSLDAISGSGGEFVIAYEPVWAIGSDRSAKPEDAVEVCTFIQGLVSDMPGGHTVRVLYGGSVNRDNAKTLFSRQGIDGGLIGGASLDAESFHFICEAAA